MEYETGLEQGLCEKTLTLGTAVGFQFNLYDIGFTKRLSGSEQHVALHASVVALL